MSDPVDDNPGDEIRERVRQHVKAETSSPSLQRYRTVLFHIALLTALGAFVVLAILVESTPSFPIDLHITRLIQSIHSPLFAGLMVLVSWPGFLPQSLIITLLIALVLFILGLRWEAATSLLAATLSGLSNELVKEIIRRPRPSLDLVDVFAILKDYSFPSGHVMLYVSLFGFVVYLIYTMLKPSWLRSFLLTFFGGLILLIGISRIYLGQHWASDVLGAYLLGSLTLAGIILLYQWGKKRFFINGTVAPQDSKFNKE